MRAREFLTEYQDSGYREIEFVCANPEFPDATDPDLQKKMLLGLKKIPGVIPLLQNWEDMSPGQMSLSAIYRQDPVVRKRILSLAKTLGVKVDLEQPVTDDYVDRAVKGEHEGQQNIAEGIIDFVKRNLGFAWGRPGDVVRGNVVADYLENNTYHSESMLEKVRRSKFQLKNIDTETAKRYRSFTDQNVGGNDVLDADKMDRTRARKITYDTLVKNPPVLDRDGFIWDGNHRIQRAIELELPSIPVLIQTKGEDFIPEDAVHRDGIDVEHHEDAEQPNIMWIRASTHGRELGRVKFLRKGDRAVALDLAVKPEYQGQGIAKIMYDYAKEIGYQILRSDEQTDAGYQFWEKHRPGKNIWEDQQPQWLYHATYRPLLASIQKHGLGGSPAQVQWEDSQPGVVYLAVSSDIAESYAESNDLVPEEWLDDIVVLKVDASRLDPQRLKVDRNVQDNTGDTLEYHGVIPVDDFSSLNEVQILGRVKGKGSDPSNLPNSGRPIQPGEESQYLGRRVGTYQDHEIWRDYLGGQVSYTLFDPGSRRAMIYTFGSRYPGNPQSYVVSGLYAAPGNAVSAAEFYRALILDLGLTLVSDRKQSPGGQRVWQQLEQFPDVEVYGYDTRSGQVLNIGASDEEMYSVPPTADQRRDIRNRDTRYTARNIRLVATKK